MPWLTHLLALIDALVADRSRLALENVALRQQIVVLKRSVKRAKIEDSDRVFWILMRRLLDSWRDALLIVKPETVIQWHRKGWKYFWRRKSLRGKPGRPPIEPAVIELIRRISRENVTWGAPRIASELALLGHQVAESTVAKYMVRHPKKPSQTWRTFLANHMSVAAACDFFVVPSLTFKPLYCYVVLTHDRRKIVHVNVTQHPTDEWTARQIVEAFPGDGDVPGFLHPTATPSMAACSGRISRRWELKRSSAPGNRPGRIPTSSASSDPSAANAPITSSRLARAISYGSCFGTRTTTTKPAVTCTSNATRPNLDPSSTVSARSSPPLTLWAPPPILSCRVARATAILPADPNFRSMVEPVRAPSPILVPWSRRRSDRFPIAPYRVFGKDNTSTRQCRSTEA